MGKLTKEQRRERRQHKRREKNKRRAARPKPWVAPKMKMFQVPPVVPADLSWEKRLEILRTIGARAKEQFDLKYPGIAAWFSDYDAIYLLSFCAFYFSAQREGTDA